MRPALALVGLMMAGYLQAEVPMDLNSPFVQTLLLREKTGEVSEQSVRKGRAKGEVLEFEKAEGGLLVLPRTQVIALLPRLPQPGAAYLQSDAQRALKVLEAVQATFSQRPEAGADAVAEWRKLASTKTGQDETQSAALDGWLERSRRISSETAPEELDRMRQEGVLYLSQFPGRSREIERELQGFKELAGIDLTKIDSLQFGFGPLGESLIPGLILWVLLILPLGLALKFFSDALRGFREGAPLAGGLRLLLGGAALAFVFLVLSHGKIDAARAVVPDKSASAAARKAGWFALNLQEKWSNQDAKKIPLSASDWLAFLQEKLVVGSGADSFPFWHLAKPKIFTTASSLRYVQPVQAKFVSLSFLFDFVLPQPGQSLTEMELVGASLGKIPLGTFLGQPLWHFLADSYQPVAEKCGINQGVRWLAGEGGMIMIEIPRAEKPKPKFKESLSARELAEVFAQGFGEIYEGKVITVEGDLVEVSSMQETLAEGTKLDKQDPMDEFTLEGLPEGPGRRYALRVRCQFKSSDSYFLDPKGDLFRAAPLAQNPAADIPILRRNHGATRVRVSLGRVESKPTETRLITLYDCRKIEGFDGSRWETIWGK